MTWQSKEGGEWPLSKSIHRTDLKSINEYATCYNLRTLTTYDGSHRTLMSIIKRNTYMI